MATLLQPFMTPGGDVFPYPRANLLIITDIASNVDRLREMVQLLDRDSFKDLKARIFKVKNASIEELGQDDPQLVMTAANLLEGSRDAGVLPSLNAIIARSLLGTTGLISRWKSCFCASASNETVVLPVTMTAGSCAWNSSRSMRSASMPVPTWSRR